MATTTPVQTMPVPNDWLLPEMWTHIVNLGMPPQGTVTVMDMLIQLRQWRAGLHAGEVTTRTTATRATALLEGPQLNIHCERG